MRFYLRAVVGLYLLITLLVALVLVAPINRDAPIAAVNAHCGVILGGTCLVDLNTGVTMHWMTYGTFVSEWSQDMQVSAYLSPADYIIYAFSREDDTVRSLSTRDYLRHFAPALSPNNKEVAYALTGDGSSDYVQLRVINRDATNDRFLTTIDLRQGRFSGDMLWSPNGRYIAYFTTQPATVTGTIKPIFWLLDTQTGKEPVIDNVAAPVVAWSPDSQYVAYVPVNADMIVIVDIETGYVPDHIRALSETPRDNILGEGVSRAAFSPDGSKIMFVTRDGMNNKTNINYRDLTTGDVVTLTSFDTATMRFEEILWREDGILVVEDRLSSSYSDYIVFHRIDPATGTTRQIGELLVEDYIRMVEW